jgi:hypothetical protein
MKTRASATPAPSNSPSVYGRSGSGSADPSPLKAWTTIQCDYYVGLLDRAVVQKL